MKSVAYLEVRSQAAKGTWPRSGPDKYVAVQIVPEGIEKLVNLNHVVAEKRGIKIIHIGEGYWNRRGPTSSLGKAIEEAKAIVEKHNRKRGDK